MAFWTIFFSRFVFHFSLTPSPPFLLASFSNSALSTVPSGAARKVLAVYPPFFTTSLLTGKTLQFYSSTVCELPPCL